MSSPLEQNGNGPWYEGITRYQWIVLIIASLGWVFDVFEGQIFVASMNEAMPALTPSNTDPGTIEFYKKLIHSAFLLGGALGGVVFGLLSDRIGRVKVMIYTILMYSFFTCISALSQEWWHMIVFRFLVAMGVGGEWAVASAMVAEVFPKRARTWSLGIFHASSVFGTYIAIAAGTFLIPYLGWRWGFVLGAFPALLTIWVRMSLKEPKEWEQARNTAQTDTTKRMGRLTDLFRPGLRRHTLVGVGLATVGLTTFWGVHINAKDLMRKDAEAMYLAELPADATEQLTNLSPGAAKQLKEQLLADRRVALKRWEMAGMLLVTTGGGFGLLAFAPISTWIGRRGAFLFYHVGALVVAVYTWQMASGIELLYVVLPIFGFLTLGMHAGYAIYFPELFPTRLRGSGAGLCFNLGRIVVVPLLFIVGWAEQSREKGGIDLQREDAATYLSLLFLVGIILLLFAPETRGKELPE
jgi:hypothetical protein